VKSSAIDEQSQWLRHFRSSDSSSVQLICFPHAGGAASYYFPYAAALGPTIQTAAVQYPGRQDRHREKCIDNIPEMAELIYEAIRRDLGRQFAFLGHSMGAILAFEVARRLQQRDGTGPCWLFASGACAPSRRRAGQTVHLRDESGLLEELRSTGGTDPRVLADQDLLATVLPVARSDYKAIETYRCLPGPRLDCPITALIGDSDPKVTVDEAAAWEEHSAGGFILRVFPGGHFYLEAHRGDVIATISATLTAWSGGKPCDRSTS
jgi:surfactin synthase thioesterase subunit